MSLSCRLEPRPGLTLVELLVSIILLGIIGTLVASGVRMQSRAQRSIGIRLAAAAQAREAFAPLVADIGLASGGDLTDGGATDSTLELHAAVATGHVCATSAADPRVAWIVVLVRRGHGAGSGDTLRAYRRDGTWAAYHLASAVEVDPGASPCANVLPRSRIMHVALDPAPAAPLDVGSPTRVSRLVRYSLYRGSDGATWLGLREWSAASARLATVQPIAGPFDGQASRFSYLDGQGAVLAPTPAPGVVAAVGVRLASPARGTEPSRLDSITILLRNGR